MGDDTKTLEQYGVHDAQCIHVIDNTTKTAFNEFEDLNAVEKYVMPDEVYDKMPDTYRKFKAR